MYKGVHAACDDVHKTGKHWGYMTKNWLLTNGDRYFCLKNVIPIAPDLVAGGIEA